MSLLRVFLMAFVYVGCVSDVLPSTNGEVVSATSQACVAAESNGNGNVSGGIGSSVTAAPSSEDVLRAGDDTSDWLGWSPGAGSQETKGVLKFGAADKVAQSGALRFVTPVNNRTTLLASKGSRLVNGVYPFQSIINVSSGADGAAQSLEIGREFWDQVLIYGRDYNINVVTDTAGWGGFLWEVEGYGHQLRLVPNVNSGVSYWLWGDHVSTALTQCTARNGKGTEIAFQAGESNNGDGGDVVLRSGYNASGGTTRRGSVKLQTHGGYGAHATMVEAAEPVAGQRVAALAGEATPARMPSGTGDGVVYIAVATTAPTTPPAAGFVLYVDPDGGALKVVGKNGTVTQLGAP